MVTKPNLLIILDGFGEKKNYIYNAIKQADTPFFDYLYTHYPHALLDASGNAVGLPKNYIGNSQVGHLTIGSGRIIPQPLTVINNAIDHDLLSKNQTLIDNYKKIKNNNKTLHIIGLLSDAGVHSHEKHLYAYLKIAAQFNINVVIHPFLDGRDTPPQSAAIYLNRLEKKMQEYGTGTIGTIHGRFYAMDRDGNWNRTQKSYCALTNFLHGHAQTWQEVLEKNYAQQIYDEFVPPTQLNPDHIITKGDGVLFINFRPDRARQLTACFINPMFNHFPVKQLDLTCFITPVSYDSTLPTNALFNPPIIHNTLKEVLADNGKTIFSIAETEKYAHVTYFFSGGTETPFKGETQIVIPSIVTKNYIQHPKMSADKITSTIIASLQTNPSDFYLINYANADMVSHSGNMQATIKAIECLDAQIKKLYDAAVIAMNGTLYITADHGHAEDMFDEQSDQPRTAHTTNPVPFIFVQKNIYDSNKQLPLWQLSDIAPFILKNMHLPIPDEMIHTS